MLPEIWSVSDIIFCHFGPLLPFYPTTDIKTWKNVKYPRDIIFLHMCTISEDHIIYGSWDIKAWQKEFFVNLGHFLPCDPPNNPKNQNFEKNEKRAWRYYYFTLLYLK